MKITLLKITVFLNNLVNLTIANLLIVVSSATVHLYGSLHSGA